MSFDQRASVADTLFARHREGLEAFLVQILRHRQAAEDVLQDVWIASRTGLDAAREPRSWLYGVAQKLALRHLRSERRRRFYEMKAAVPEADDSAHEQVAQAMGILGALESILDDRDRAMLLLYHLHGFTAIDLAAALEITPEAVRQRLSRANRRVASALRTRDENGDV